MKMEERVGGRAYTGVYVCVIGTITLMHGGL